VLTPDQPISQRHEVVLVSARMLQGLQFEHVRYFEMGMRDAVMKLCDHHWLKITAHRLGLLILSQWISFAITRTAANKTVKLKAQLARSQAIYTIQSPGN
jgi:hypothetical protein